MPLPNPDWQDWKSILSAGVYLLLLPVAIYKWAKESLANVFTHLLSKASHKQGIIHHNYSIKQHFY